MVEAPAFRVFVPLKQQPWPRESGAALLAVLSLVVAGLALAASAVSVLLTGQRAVRETRDQAIAFYLAEGALEIAKWEIGTNQDPDGDGLGSDTGTATGGSFVVTSQDLGGNTWLLQATGTAGTVNMALEEVVGMSGSSGFPFGALTVMGETDTLQLQTASSTNMILDGVDTAAIAVADSTLYNDLGNAFADAIDDGYVDESNITGAVTNDFGGVDLSITELSASGSPPTMPETLYDDARTYVKDNYLSSASNR